MKTKLRSALAPALVAGILSAAVCIGTTQAQTTIDFDRNPSFDFGPAPGADALFAPELLGLTNGMADYTPVAAVSAAAERANRLFPPAREVFLAYWGNPRYALLTDTTTASISLGAGNPLSLAVAFQSAGGTMNVVPGRTAAFGMSGGPIGAIMSGILGGGGGIGGILGGFYTVSPLVLDLDGDGQLSASRGLWLPHPARLTGPYAAFDMDGDGYKDITEWIGAGDALLTTSRNPTSGRDLLGTAGGWPDGFAQLAARFDYNADAIIEGTERDGLYLWRDWNTNAIAELGEVASLDGLVRRMIGVDMPLNFTAQFESSASPGTTGIAWDWWPNYALVNKRGAGGAAPKQGVVFRMVGVQNETNLPAPTNGLLHTAWHVTPGEIGADPASFRLAMLSCNGRVLIGYDKSGMPVRVRLLQIRHQAGGPVVVTCLLPFEEMFQLACDPAGDHLLVLGDQGSKLAYVDFPNQRVTPESGFELRSAGLRASGLAGCAGGFWFTAWELDTSEAVVAERVWALTPGGWVVEGLSLDALRDELGELRSFFLTGPTSGFFAAPTPGGENETLWWVNGSCNDTCRVAVAQADSFGGMHAIPGQVVYTRRDGEWHGIEGWWGVCQAPAACRVTLATNNAPIFYPFLTDGGGTVIAAELSPQTDTMVYHAWTTPTPGGAPGAGNPSSPGEALLTAHLGQAKVARGAFAHYDTNGIDVLPMPDNAPTPPSQRVWHYTLLPDSRLTDDCPVCARPAISVPVAGTFSLRLIQETPLYSSYAWETIAWTAGIPAGTTYKIVGSGRHEIGGEAGLFQDLSLDVFIDNGITNRRCHFTITNGVHDVTRPWPLIEISVDQTNGTDVQQYRFELAAAPVREIWFSTAHGFTPGVQPLLTNHVSGGDLISATGRVVKRNRDLSGHLGLMPSPDPFDLGLDAVQILPTGEIAFSIEGDAFSERLGQLHHGDALSDRGRVVRRYAGLMAPFGAMPPVMDHGLDALQVMDSGEVYFSIETEFFSERLGVSIRRGDLLSSEGRVVKTGEQLLARFHPPPIPKDFGLDAIHVWPGGEVWFSLEEGFEDAVLGPIQRGDLLSDRGELLYRNLDLLREFQPLEDLADFGLDALYIVSDALAPAVTTARCTVNRPDPATGDLKLQWETQGRLYQVEKATQVLGPWFPLSSISPDPDFTDAGALTNTPQAFYRLREW